MNWGGFFGIQDAGPSSSRRLRPGWSRSGVPHPDLIPINSIPGAYRNEVRNAPGTDSFLGLTPRDKCVRLPPQSFPQQPDFAQSVDLCPQMASIGAVSTARPAILVVISSNLPLPGCFAVTPRDRFYYHLAVLPAREANRTAVVPKCARSVSGVTAVSSSGPIRISSTESFLMYRVPGKTSCASMEVTSVIFPYSSPETCCAVSPRALRASVPLSPRKDLALSISDFKAIIPAVPEV